jgi:uncharacterized protein (TIGR02284 family)
VLKLSQESVETDENEGVAMHTQDTIRTLNRLIQTCRDGEEFCRAASESVDSIKLRPLFRFRSEEWGRQGDELQALVLLLRGDPATFGTAEAQVLRGWMKLKALIFGRSDLSVLEQWRVAQQHALARYEEALSGYLPQRIRRTVSLQADRVLDRAEQIETIRDRFMVHSQGA